MGDDEFLAGITDGGDRGVLLLDVAEVNSTLGELVDHDLADSLELVGILGGKRDEFRLGQLDLCAAPLEIEPGRQLLHGLIDRILDLHPLNFGNNVKGRHG